MRDFYDILIVGAGLAGATAALYLSWNRSVLLLEAEHPAAGASGAAAGLVNPLMARRARPVWRMAEALDALHETIAAAGADGMFDDSGVLRPAMNPEQAGHFQQAAAQFPEEAAWLSPPAAAERCPSVHVPHGALHVRSGGAITVPAFVEALLAAAHDNGAEIHTGCRVAGWGEADGAAFVETDAGERLRAGTVLLAMGYGSLTHPALAALNLHGIKGQTVRVRRPGGLGEVPLLSGSGYVVPDGDTLIVGSSYEHDFADLQPSPEQTRRILRKAQRMLPGLAETEVVAVTTGVRVTVPRIRLPMLGSLPGHRRCWIFTGLSSKGLLMAPLLARSLPRFLTDPATLPPEVRVSACESFRV